MGIVEVSEPLGLWLVVEMPMTGGEPQEDFGTEEEAKAFIQRLRDGLNPFSGRPLAEHPYEYPADNLAVITGYGSSTKGEAA